MLNSSLTLLATEYKRKARNVDREYVGTPEGEVGPVEHRLDKYGDLLGLVVGHGGRGRKNSTIWYM